MPIYEYRCRKCGQEFEVLVQGYNDGGPRKCDHCSGRLEKLLSPAAVIYKGSGFHTTDYCRGSDGNGAEPKKDWKEKAEQIKAQAGSSSDNGAGGDKKKKEKAKQT